MTFERSLEMLAAWFKGQQRVLPWREDSDVYRVWISEIMLQQTQVVTVIPYFEKFIARFPTLPALAEAPIEDVLLHWAGLGYYSRARNLHRAAQQIVAQGGFPSTREGWLDVPGVGEYTAGAILSIALNQPEAILDGNVERVLSRVRRMSRLSGDTPYKDRLWRFSRAVVTQAHAQGIAPSVTNQALMELGATVCSPKKPKCGVCPVADVCRARAADVQENYPPKKKRKEWLEVQEKLQCLIDPEGRVLLRRREAGEWRAGLWDLPGDLPFSRTELRFVGEIHSKHVVTRHRITRTTGIWVAKKVPLQAAEVSGGVRWIDPGKPEVAIGSALKKTLSQARETYPEAWPTSSAPQGA